MIDLFLLNSSFEEKLFELSSDSRFRVHSLGNSDDSNLLDIEDIVNDRDTNFFVICDRNDFLTHCHDYSKVITLVDEASLLGADILYGGAESFEYGLSVSESLFWVDSCFNPSYAIILRKLFPYFLANSHGLKDIRSLEDLNNITSNKFLIYPFISIKKTKGEREYDSSLNLTAMERLAVIKKVKQHYLISDLVNLSDYDIDSLKIPTYVINLRDRPERRSHIMNEFRGKSEFDLHITRAHRHERGATGLWHSICSIVKTAVANDDDVIIIVEDDHMFTEHYDRKIFINNIILAGSQGADILSGGISGGFNYAIPITPHRCWINYFWGTQFIVLYKKIFEFILNSEFGNTDTADDFLSSLSVNKMVLFPFISVQKDFGYSDITSNNAERGDLSKIFVSAEKKLERYFRAYKKYIENSSLSS